MILNFERETRRAYAFFYTEGGDFRLCDDGVVEALRLSPEVRKFTLEIRRGEKPAKGKWKRFKVEPGFITGARRLFAGLVLSATKFGLAYTAKTRGILWARVVRAS